MWLLKFHTAFSTLCLIVALYVVGFISEERKNLIKEIFKPEKKGSLIDLIISCYVPIVNLFFAIGALAVMFASEDTLRELANRRKDD